ncbi:MAG: hypothetical protein RR249_09150, partial [Tannerellaceae bacterium]
ITEKKIVDQKSHVSHVSHELTERQIDGGVKRGILILKSAVFIPFCHPSGYFRNLSSINITNGLCPVQRTERLP